MISLELAKEKRTGIIQILLITGLIGALYVLLNYKVRGDALLNMPISPMDALLTQLYGMIMILNVFALIVATCITFNMEYSGLAIKKMYILPTCLWKMYLSKFLIIIGGFLIAVIIQNAALLWIGYTKLEGGMFQMGMLMKYSIYTYITSLPVISFMLLISSAIDKIWVTLGTGVAGFLSAMALSQTQSPVIQLHPFLLMFKPAMGSTAEINVYTIIVSLIETGLYFAIGAILLERKNLE